MPLFRHLTYKEIIRVLNLTEVSDYGPGEDIMQEGEPGDDLYILLRGRVRLHKEGAFITTCCPAPIWARWPSSIALPARPPPPPRSGPGSSSYAGRSFTRSSARIRRCR